MQGHVHVHVSDRKPAPVARVITTLIPVHSSWNLVVTGYKHSRPGLALCIKAGDGNAPVSDDRTAELCPTAAPYVISIIDVTYCKVYI